MFKKISAAAVLSLFILGAGCAPVSEYKKITEPEPATNFSTSEKKPIINIEEKIDISGRKLKNIPMAIFDHDRAIELNVSNNQLTGAIPAEIRKMEKLRILNMSGNNLTGIPAEVGQLKDLKTLDISNNKITGLPLEIGNLKNLQTFIISGNNVSKADLAKITEKLPDLKVID